MTRRAISFVLVLLALPVSTKALDGDVTIYGTVSPFFDNLRASGATKPGLSPASGGATQVAADAYTGLDTPARFRLTSGTSNLGFKGGLDLLGEDLQVFFQVESAVSLDGEAPSSWNGRNTGAGLKGKFGRVLFGIWDTPYKYATPFMGAIRSLNPYDNGLVGYPGFGVPATTTQTGRTGKAADASFSRRQGNSLQYWSPEVMGFSARLAYSANEGKTSETKTARSISPAVYSGLLSYVKGPVTVRYGYERHEDYFGLTQLGGSAAATATNDGSTDEGHELVAHLSLPTGTRISGIVERLTFKNQEAEAGKVSRYTRDAYFALVQQRFAEHQLWGSFGQALPGECAVVDGSCRTGGLGATQYALGYSYALGKSAEVYAAFYRLVNARSASYAVVSSPAVPPGSDTTGVGLGILYTFQATATVGSPKGTP